MINAACKFTEANAYSITSGGFKTTIKKNIIKNKIIKDTIQLCGKYTCRYLYICVYKLYPDTLDKRKQLS